MAIRKQRGSRFREPSQVLDAFDYGIDEALLNAFCSYTLSKNISIHKYGLVSLAKLIEGMTEDQFAKNQKMLLKFRFLKIILNVRINENILDRDLILSSANRIMDINSLLVDPNFIRELSDAEVVYVEKTITSFSNNNYLTAHIKEWMDLADKYRSGTYRDREVVLPQIRQCMSSALTQFRKNDMVKDSSSNTFRLSTMQDSIEDIHRYVTSPSTRLITGMTGLNAMLGGGFEKAREYVFLALSGEGKTITLENLFYQVWKNNKGIETRDPTKKPAIVYLTMENFVIELVSSLYHIITRGKEMQECATPEDALEEFKKCQFYYNGDNDIEMVIKFKPVNSVDTSYLYTITEELEDEGFEVIAFFQDYLMRINPSVITRDTYKDLGTVANDFKTFATLKQCPLITASQLNREAAKIIDESRGRNDPNLVKKLGRANAGDSVNIERNIDGMLILVPEISASGEKFMGIKLVKHRYKIYTYETSIYHPYYPGSDIALVEDIYSPVPVHRANLARNEEELRAQFSMANQTNFANIATLVDSLNGIEQMSSIPYQVNDNHPIEEEDEEDEIQIVSTNEQKKPQEYSLNIKNIVEKRELVRWFKPEEIEPNMEKFKKGLFYKN